MAGEANNLAPWTTVPEECAPHVRRYLTGPAYRSDLELVAREASAYARAAAAAAADGAWVFDVDETLLSNLPYYAQHGYGLELFELGNLTCVKVDLASKLLLNRYESREVVEEKWRRHRRKKWRNFLMITTLLLFMVGYVLCFI